jgi:hypothetical protein
MDTLIQKLNFIKLINRYQALEVLFFFLLNKNILNNLDKLGIKKCTSLEMEWTMTN